MAHFVTGRHCTVVTDQRSVSFMCSGENRGKIKNDEVLRWRMELHEFDFEIVYRSGKLNSAPDALSRVYCANMNGTTLHDIHASLCHPGIPHLHHFVRAKNLPYSVEDVRQTVRDCSVCSELKPNFYKPPATHLVKAIQPFERLSLYFKGSLPSSTKNRYMLTVIDEFSRFPLAFLCSSVDAKTVVSCANCLFVLFGMPAYIHSDRGTAFISHALTSYLHRHGVACSKTSVYNAPGNG